MGIFDIFKKKNAGPAMKDLVWMSRPHKLLGAVKLYEEHKGAVLIAWFNNTEIEFSQLFQSKFGIPPQIKMAKQVLATSVLDKTVIFLEHYPLRGKEENLMTDWRPRKVFVLNSLDEPLFTRFGAEKIISLLEKMGMKSDEMLENSMISKALENAQRKLDKKILSESLANSADEWFRKNFSPEY
jgi:hypothetical protein